MSSHERRLAAVAGALVASLCLTACHDGNPGSSFGPSSNVPRPANVDECAIPGATCATPPPVSTTR